MGMLPPLTLRWESAQAEHLALQRRSSFIIGGFSSLTRMARLMAQSGVLSLCAYLAISGEISAGTIIAASILTSRALAPVELAIASWRGFAAARQGYARLRQVLASRPEAAGCFELPAPKGGLSVEALAVGAPGAVKPIIRNVRFRLDAGRTLGILGPSASGKSTLARALMGVWSPLAGKVMLDGADLRQWPAAQLGAHLGYLPQDVQLFDGTVAENIARFHHPVDAAAVLVAATAAGLHAHLLSLPEGYETRIGAGGLELSAGQKQRLGLARALYGDPFLVVLDEPNSNLDIEGEKALRAAIAGIATRGGIAVVIAHRISVIATVDLLAVMRDGAMTSFGPREQILASLQPRSTNGTHRTETAGLENSSWTMRPTP
jgi:PrtD family type I secretion system ABC transporter